MTDAISNNTPLVQRAIRQKLAGLRWGLRARLLAEGLAWLVIVTISVIFISLGFDYVLHLDRPLRIFVTALGAAAILFVIWRRLVQPLAISLPDADLALLVERHYSQLGDRLVGALCFEEQDERHWGTASRAMIHAMARQANALAGNVNFRKVIERKNLWRVTRIAACALTLLVGFALWQGATLKLWAARNIAFSDVLWPQRTHLYVEGGPDFAVFRGDDLVVTIRAFTDPEDPSPPPAYITLHTTYASLGKIDPERLEAVRPGSNVYVKIFRGTVEPFEFYVTGDDDELDRRRPHRVSVYDPPQLQEVAFQVDYPPYTGERTAYFSGMQPVLAAPAGSWIHVTGTSTKDLSAATVRLDMGIRAQARSLSQDAEELARSCILSGRALTEATKGQSVDSFRQALTAMVKTQAEASTKLAELSKRYEAMSAHARNVRPDNLASVEEAAAAMTKLLAELKQSFLEQAARSQSAAASPTQSAADTILAENVENARRLRSVSKIAMELAGLFSQRRALKLFADRDGRMRQIAGSVYVSGPSRVEALDLVFDLVDDAGRAARQGSRYVLRVQPDLPPDVGIRRRGVGLVVTPRAKLPLQLDFRDDHGLAAARILLSCDGGKAVPVGEALDLRGTSAEFTREHPFDLQTLDLKPGQTIGIRVEVDDTLPVSLGGPNRRRSGVLEFRIVSAEELMTELVRRQKELSMEFLQTIAMQESARAKTAAAAEQLANGQITSQDRDRLSSSSALQQTVSLQCVKTADSLEAILVEMRCNRLGEEVDHQNLAEEIIAPLRNLAGPMEKLVTRIKAGENIQDAKALQVQVAEIAELQRKFRVQMEEIHKKMLMSQTRYDIANRLEDLIGRSKNLLELLRKLEEQQFEETSESDD